MTIPILLRKWKRAAQRWERGLNVRAEGMSPTKGRDFVVDRDLIVEIVKRENN